MCRAIYLAKFKDGRYRFTSSNTFPTKVSKLATKQVIKSNRVSDLSSHSQVDPFRRNPFLNLKIGRRQYYNMPNRMVSRYFTARWTDIAKSSNTSFRTFCVIKLGCDCAGTLVERHSRTHLYLGVVMIEAERYSEYTY